MYFLTYKFNEKVEIGILDKEQKNIIPMSEMFSKLGKNSPETMLDFILKSNENLIGEMENVLKNEELQTISKVDVQVCAPILDPRRNIICVGKNYSDHAKELKGKTDANVPDFPIYFTKSPNTVIGDGDKIKNHSEITQHIDYEVELAVIIGKDGVNIKPENAFEYIFGYTVANDISARNLQIERTQWFKGKSLDTFCPMGPYVVYKNSLPFPLELDVMCKVNGEVRQNSNTQLMIFDIPYIISDLSKGMELKAGDIILTGTPSGVGLGFDPPKFLKSGDKIETYIEKIGTLINEIE